MNIKLLLLNLLRKLRKNEENALEGFKSIGVNVIINENMRIQFKDRINIGNHVYIGKNIFMNGRGGISIGDYSIISDDVIILSSQHNYDNAELLPYDQVELLSPVNIGRCCWIGMRVIILPGVQILEGCIVGAGAIVTKSFPKGSIIAGNPATVIAKRNLSQYEKLINSNKFYLIIKNEKHLAKIEKLVPKKPFV